MQFKTYKFFNNATRLALSEKLHGYVNKVKPFQQEQQELSQRYNIDRFYRFDLGENADGYTPKVRDMLENLYQNNILFTKINEYPDVTHLGLRMQLADFYNIPRENIVLSTGLDSILDLVTRVFIEPKDVYLMPVPDFYLFETYSERMGAIPVFMELQEDDDFTWTSSTLNVFFKNIIKFRPKIVWLSNPGNPTGNIIDQDILLEIIDFAASYNVFVVIDEAYGEYMGDTSYSAVKYLHDYKNLMVLRTFSKAYGLAGIRLGYLMSSSREIVDALLVHRHHFPVTQLSLNIAQVALHDQGFLEKTRTDTKNWRDDLFNSFKKLRSFKLIPSETNIFMLRSKFLTASELKFELKKHGIIPSDINLGGLPEKKYLRLTIRTEEENQYLYKVCEDIDKNLFRE